MTRTVALVLLASASLLYVAETQQMNHPRDESSAVVGIVKAAVLEVKNPRTEIGSGTFARADAVHNRLQLMHDVANTLASSPAVVRLIGRRKVRKISGWLHRIHDWSSWLMVVGVTSWLTSLILRFAVGFGFEVSVLMAPVAIGHIVHALLWFHTIGLRRIGRIRQL